MTLTIHGDMEQGSDEWRAARCGMLTASEMRLIVTPTFKPASNEKERAHLYELLAQRITQYVEPHYIGDDMLRGQEDELDARALYARHYAPVTQCGFMVRNIDGLRIGYSPDGLVGDDGQIECKSRRARFQVETLVSGEMPAEYVAQVQTGLLVSGRAWCDFVSFSGGLPMVTIRVFPDAVVQQVIIDAARAFEDRLAEKLARYNDALAAGGRLIPTTRRIEQEMF